MPRRARAERDPMASESDDEDFSPGADSRPAKRPAKRQKTAGKSASKSAKNKKRRRGSGIDSDDDLDLDDSFGEQSEDEEEVELNPVTGRRVRGVAKRQVTYEENSEEEEEAITSDSEDDSDPSPKKPAARKGRAPAAKIQDDEDDGEDPAPRKSRIVKLRVGKGNLPPATPEPEAEPEPVTTRRGKSARASKNPTSRAGSIQRSTRNTSSRSVEPLLEGLPNTTRRMTRARSSEVEAMQSSSRTRRTVGTKGVAVAATIKEEIHETSSYEQPVEGDELAGAEIQGTDEQDETIDRFDQAQEIADDQPEEEQSDNGEAQPAMDSIEDDDDDDDAGPIVRTRATRQIAAADPAEEIAITSDAVAEEEKETSSRRITRAKTKPKKADEVISDFDPDEAGTDASMSDNSATGNATSKNRGHASKTSSRNNRESSDSIDAEEVREELDDIRTTRTKRKHHTDNADGSNIEYEHSKRRRTANINYRIATMNEVIAQEDEEVAPEPRRTKNGRGGGGGWDRSLYSTFGPFGGGGGPAPVIRGPWGTGATGGVDSDSSDDEGMMRPSGMGGNVGMTPTSAFPPGLLPGMAQTNNADALGASGATPNVGKIKSAKALADADPLGVDQNVDFSKIGGLDGHIDQLKEMVMMPLLYPELFQKFNVTPPRGVLFHGPPGTGKTLLARALAASVGSSGKKVTFYMRKGADALSKWVGEAERQLRLLFEEARKTQPSIIFFDEIDGLAPVRSSKQEQIHASIVSTLLALMDGMDGRGQVIVIGATNRPDNIDPALRRPGRFDREFYFPLPGIEARKSIINIHTTGWEVDDNFKTKLAELTKGYGGADLRALCTEAALNSIQRTYPQIYSSNDKLLIDADKIKINAKDFMISIKKMIPSSERSTSSGATPLPKVVEPLLRAPLQDIEKILDGLIPIKKKTTALQEAMFEQYDDEDFGFQRETMQQDFERSRVFRPRLLICGEAGMGQQYLGGAILNHFEGLHVQSFDLPTIYSETSRSPESAIVQLFAEVKRHKPSVIYLPAVDTWYSTLPENVIITFLGLLKAIPPNDPVMVLGITDTPQADLDPMMLRDLFGFSEHNRFSIKRPTRENRAEFFQPIIDYARKCPKDFPEPLNRKKRKLEVLPLAPIPPPIPPTKEELKALKKRDHQILNLLKIQIQPIVDQIQKKYRKFRNPVIPRAEIEYLYDESDPEFVQPDLQRELRPYEIDVDKNGVTGLRQTATGKFFYNLETTTIEERLSNGFYARPKDFLADIKTLAKDAKSIGDRERTLKANELVANVEVDIASYEALPLFADCENIYLRRLKATKEAEEKARLRAGGAVDQDDVFNPIGSDIQSQSAAPILGEAIPGRLPPLMTPSHLSSLSNGYGGSNERTSNGTSAPSHAGDTQMTGVNSGFSQGSPMHPPMHRGSGHNTQVSQRSAWQELSLGTSPSQIQNDASTTTSGKKTSDGWSTQATNGISNQYSSPMDRPQQESYQANTQVELSSSQLSSQKDQIIDEAFVTELLRHLVDGSSGCSVEQLEQVFRELMDTLWTMRGEWNRSLVTANLVQVFNATIHDIEAIQKVQMASQPTDNDFSLPLPR